MRDVLPPGTMLDGKYRIDRLIGAGGFGMTYEAHDVGLNMQVAVKEYYPASFGARDGTLTVRPRTDNDAELFHRLKESFLREARTLAQLRHPCIVRVLSVFEGHGTAYMIMEFESGQSLKSWLEKLGRRPTQSELDKLVMPLLDALEMIHAAGFLHRDIAPDNIIVRAGGSPVLLDFGAARRVMAELSGALTGIVKSGYSPQEQYTNDPRAQGPWSDIYALGATLYRCIAGKTPDEATIRMLDDPTMPLSGLGFAGYRTGFLAAIDKAMSVRPKDRQQSIAELRGSLLGEGDAKTAALSRTDPSRPDATVTTSGGWNRIPSPPAAKPPASGRALWALGVAGLVAVLLGGAGWAMFEWRSQQNAEVARIETERLQREATVKADADRRRLEAERQKIELDKERREVEKKKIEDARLAKRQADKRSLSELIGRRDELLKELADEERSGARDGAIAARLRFELEDINWLIARAREQQQAGPSRQRPQAGPTGGKLAALIEASMGPCPFCDDVRKITTESEFAELTGLPAMIERTIADVVNRRGPLEDAKGRTYLDLLAKVALDPDPYAAIKAGNVRCTIYHVGFLDNAVQRVGEHQCVVRMVLIGGELTSLTIEKTSGDGFHANVKRFRVNAPAFLGRTYLKGHAVTRYNQAQPFNKENRNFGNKVGILVALGGKPVLISMNQNGFTEPDNSYFEMMVLE